MNIGIIGSGRMGSGLGSIWAEKGHNVFFSFSRSREKLEGLAASVPNARSGTPAEAVEASEIILFSFPWISREDALKAAGPISGKIVIDCTNPLTRDFDGLAVGCTTSGGEELARMVPGARVVKAFNTVFAEVYHTPSRLYGSRRATMFYCGDDREAKADVSKLIQHVGFEPIDAGPLSTARYLEPMAMLMMQLGYGQNMGTNIALNLIRR
jgi:hypothetical protein